MQEPYIRENYRLAHHIQLYDGIHDVLQRGLRTAVATGKDGPHARALLADLDVLPLRAGLRMIVVQKSAVGTDERHCHDGSASDQG